LFNNVMDWVFTGHVHVFQSFKPIRYPSTVVSNFGNKTNEGTGYLIVPPAGNWPETGYLSSFKSWLNYPASESPSEIGFTKVLITNRSIAINTYMMGTMSIFTNCRIVDSISYTK